MGSIEWFQGNQMLDKLVKAEGIELALKGVLKDSSIILQKPNQ